MPDGPNVREELEVYITSSASTQAPLKMLGTCYGTDSWKDNTFKFTPESDGEYHVAFHSTSPAMSNATLIDDVRVSAGDIAGFYGAIGVTFGKTDLVARSYTVPYRIGNTGTAPLVVDYESSSPEIKVSGVPVTVPPGYSRDIQITFTPTTTGNYQGQYVLSTNDPRHPTVDLIAISEVLDVPVTGFVMEDFESAGPKGWVLPLGVVNTDYVKGHNGPRTLYTRGFYTLDEDEEIGFTTHYVEMGTDPSFEMWIKFISCDLLGAQQGALSADVPQLQLYVSDDYGENWTEVWKMEPGGENAHTGAEDFYLVKVNLPEYAGKTCRFKAVLHNTKSIDNDFIFLADDIAIGTRPDVDLRAFGLNGPAAVDIDSFNQVSVTVENTGSKDSDYYEVKLLDKEGHIIDAADGYDLAPGQRKEFKLWWEPMIEGPSELRVVVTGEKDNNHDNDSSNVHNTYVLDRESKIVVDDSPLGYIANVPVNFRAPETAVQTIYYANELGIDAGLVNAITFTSFFDVEHLTENFEVLIAETDIQDFSGNVIIPESEFTKVFEGQYYLPAGATEFTVPFSSPFRYNGRNLVVMTRKLSDSFIGTKCFMVHESERPRTIESISMVTNGLADSDYPNREAMNLYAHAVFNMIKPESGKVTGRVHAGDNMIEGVEVRLEGTQLYTFTDKDGAFEFPEIKTGTRKFTVSGYGYYTGKAQTEVSVAEDSYMDIELTPYPLKSLEGIVSDTAGNPVEGAKVVLTGYSDYSALTDSKGRYTIGDIYADTGVPYDARVESLYYTTLRKHDLAIDGDTRLDATLKAEVLRPFALSVDEQDGSATLGWEDPLPEFAYDNGEPVTYLGWSHGHSKTAIFNVFHQKVRIKEIRFFITDSQGPHANVNLMIFRLGADGRPDNTSKVWSATAVPFNDNEWTSYILDKPVTIEDFAIAISCDGYLGLGATASDEEYPFAEKTHFFAGDNYEMDWDIMDFSVFDTVHPMLRVSGDYMGDASTDPMRHSAPENWNPSRPDVEYDIYRYDGAMSDASKVKVATVTSPEYLDDTYADLPYGKYNYAVVARYADGESDEVVASINKKDPLSVTQVATGTGAISYDGAARALSVNEPGDIAFIAIHSVDGIPAGRIDNVQALNSVAFLQPGAYIVTAVTVEGGNVTRKIIVY